MNVVRSLISLTVELISGAYFLYCAIRSITYENDGTVRIKALTTMTAMAKWVLTASLPLTSAMISVVLLISHVLRLDSTSQSSSICRLNTYFMVDTQICCTDKFDHVDMSSGNKAATGRVHGLCPLACNSETTYRFRRLIISSRKKLYRVTSISRTIARYPPNQTFVCSQMEVLNRHLPSLTNSGNEAGLQNLWQWVSVSLCLLLKWNTSTGFPVFWKCVSAMARWCWSS